MSRQERIGPSCYREVAVISPHWTRRAMRWMLLGGAVLACGCGDMITNGRAAREEGLERYQHGDYGHAASSLQYAVRQEPGDYTSHYYLGQSYDHMNQPQHAIEEYRTTLRVMENSLEGQTDREFRLKVIDALAHSIANEPYKAPDISLLERQPKTSENLFLLAKVYRYSQDPDSAIERYTQAALQEPRDFAIAKDYGLYLEQLGQTKRADAELRRAYALNTKDEQVAAALRRLGVVPGPSLKDEGDLAKPAIPLGPLPEIEVGGTTPTRTQPQPNSSGNVGTTSSPRD